MMFDVSRWRGSLDAEQRLQRATGVVDALAELDCYFVVGGGRRGACEALRATEGWARVAWKRRWEEHYEYCGCGDAIRVCMCMCPCE